MKLDSEAVETNKNDTTVTFFSCCIVRFSSLFGIQEVVNLTCPFLLSRLCQPGNSKSVAIFTSSTTIT